MTQPLQSLIRQFERALTLYSGFLAREVQIPKSGRGAMLAPISVYLIQLKTAIPEPK